LHECLSFKSRGNQRGRWAKGGGNREDEGKKDQRGKMHGSSRDCSEEGGGPVSQTGWSRGAVDGKGGGKKPPNQGGDQVATTGDRGGKGGLKKEKGDREARSSFRVKGGQEGGGYQPRGGSRQQKSFEKKKFARPDCAKKGEGRK